MKDLQSVKQRFGIIGNYEGLNRAIDIAVQVAPTDLSVLITGESGTGKEVFPQVIHSFSLRKHGPYIAVNCGAIPEGTIDSELFGHEKGAFTDAFARQIGRFEIAHGSTLFLDEISELPLALQAKLLRVLQDGEFERLGNPRTIRVDVRIIAATNKDLSLAVAEGRFREDLFYRLNVFPILVPPLRDRREDIPLFVWGFVREFEKNMGKHITAISKKTTEVLQSYGWPGNVRELRNVIERAMILSQHGTLLVELPDKNPGKGSPVSTSLADIERQHISDVLAKTGGRIRGKHGAAEILGLKPSTLDSKMKKLGIRRRLDLHEIP